MKRNALKSLGLGLALVTVAAAPTAFGALTDLPANNSISLDNSYTIDLTGKTAADSQTTAFANSFFSGTIKSDVYNFDAAGLIFVYTVTVDNVFSGSGLQKLDVYVEGYNVKVGGIASASDAPGPKSAYLYTPQTVTFDWGNTPVGAGVTDTAVVQTLNNFTSWRQSSVDLEPGGAEAAITPAPEPTTLAAGAMLLLPFAASTLRMIRRKNA